MQKFHICNNTRAVARLEELAISRRLKVDEFKRNLKERLRDLVELVSLHLHFFLSCKFSWKTAIKSIKPSIEITHTIID